MKQTKRVRTFQRDGTWGLKGKSFPKRQESMLNTADSSPHFPVKLAAHISCLDTRAEVEGTDEKWKLQK